MSIINPQESVPVNIGNFVMYCEKFKVTGTKSFSEQNTVSGNEIVTNSGKKAVRIVLNGRISGDNPLEFIVNMNNLMYNSDNISIEYKNVIFNQCQIQSFVADDQNNNYISVTLTIIAIEISTTSGESS